MDTLSSTKFKNELRSAIIASEFRSCDVLNQVRHATNCSGVISAQAVVEYPDGLWALRGGFNVWSGSPNADFPVEVTMEPGNVRLVVPAGFQPRQGELRLNDRPVDQRFYALAGIMRPTTRLALS